MIRNLTAGITALQQALAGQQSRASLVAFLRATSPACPELVAIWDVQTSAKDTKVLPQLLLLLSSILDFKPQPGPAGTAAAAAATAELGGGSAAVSDSELVAAAQQALIRHCLQRKLKQLYHALGSDTRNVANAALQLLGSVAGHSAAAARDLTAAFDFSLAALAKLAKPHRCGSASRSASGREEQALGWRFGWEVGAGGSGQAGRRGVGAGGEWRLPEQACVLEHMDRASECYGQPGPGPQGTGALGRCCVISHFHPVSQLTPDGQGQAGPRR